MDYIGNAIREVDKRNEPEDPGKPSKEEIQEIVNGTGSFSV